MTFTPTFIKRLAATGSVLAVLTVGVAACTSTSTESAPSTAATDTSTETTDSVDSTDSSDSTTETAAATAESPTLEELVAEVAGEFSQVEWTDPDTGEVLTYNIYLPEDYDETQSYPLVVYIPDSSLVGDDPTAALSQYGALIWASETQQAQSESIVVVPAFPEVILDDHDSFTMTEYVEMTARLVEDLTGEYAVDTDRVYGTGQSMGAMTIMYLAAQYPDLFAAEMIVSGQWDITQLSGLADETFVYTAAAGDEKASTGQTDVEAMLDAAGVSYNTALFDATWSDEESAAAAEELLSSGDSAYFLTFAEGTVLEAGDSSSEMGGEHMASFQPAYEIAGLRTWLFEQTAS
ncbi:alpha/beta hydrolase-fold protein [Microbacterium oryzae]|uniref:carboxylesterase family protein n=1 Tax=Microbacterium oryzae TaxID=743009 RepID=UPI0025B1AF1B|nr:alpha/beta hydrolase-fold protein [Microbacterium oryzae]MDN3312194.1 alpha/beta hydrolase-fold protein [Microbacterium oryzae]